MREVGADFFNTHIFMVTTCTSVQRIEIQFFKVPIFHEQTPFRNLKLAISQVGFGIIYEPRFVGGNDFEFNKIQSIEDFL